MEHARIKVIENKPSIQIDRSWFPYRAVVNQREYEKICSIIEMQIAEFGLRNIKISYGILDTDDNGNPIEFLIESNYKTGFLRSVESSYILKVKAELNIGNTD